MKTSMEVPQKIKHRTNIRSNNPTSRYIVKGNESKNSKRDLHSHVHCSIIHIRHDMATT